MLKAAIEKILTLAKPVTVQVGGRSFLLGGSGDYDRVPEEDCAEPLAVGTLSAILEYITGGADENALDTERRFIIHVRDHQSVDLCMELNRDKRRETLLRACTAPARFPEGRFLDVESFVITMQQYFVDGENVRALLKLVSNVTDGNSVQQTDDGVSQSVTARSGISLVQRETVPNPVTLAPYRTFREIEQPESPFVFRLRGGGDGVSAALFTADGNQWQYEAVQRIREYFVRSLPPELADEVIILA